MSHYYLFYLLINKTELLSGEDVKSKVSLDECREQKRA